MKFICLDIVLNSHVQEFVSEMKTDYFKNECVSIETKSNPIIL